MPFIKTDFPDLLIFEPVVFEDSRGYFFESYNEKVFSTEGVDIRKGSPTYGKAFSIELTAENKKQLLVPKGFAHGYSVLSETAEVMYKCDAFYNKAAEGGVLYNDPALNIDWNI